MKDITKLKQKLSKVKFFHKPLCTFCKAELTSRNLVSAELGTPACTTHNPLIQQMYRKKGKWYLTSKAGFANARKLGVDESVIVLYLENPPPTPAVQAGTLSFEKGIRTGVGGTNTNESIHLAEHPSHIPKRNRRRVSNVRSDTAPLQQPTRAPYVASVGSQNIRAREDDPY